MFYDVTIQCPILDRPMTHRMVGANRVDLKARTFYYNGHYPACPILEVENVSQDYVDSVAAWCEKHGTAGD
jgi:hypothetical protein